MEVRHEGRPDRADLASVVHRRGGELYCVRARGVVMGVGAGVGERVVADLPPDRRAALDRFLHSLCMIVSVAGAC